MHHYFPEETLLAKIDLQPIMATIIFPYLIYRLYMAQINSFSSQGIWQERWACCRGYSQDTPTWHAQAPPWRKTQVYEEKVTKIGGGGGGKEERQEG